MRRVNGRSERREIFSRSGITRRGHFPRPFPLAAPLWTPKRFFTLLRTSFVSNRIVNSSRQERRELKVSVKNCVEKERKKGRGNDLKLSVINKRGERKDGTSREREKKRKKYDHSSENSREKGEGGISRGERASAIVRVKNRVKKKRKEKKDSIPSERSIKSISARCILL